MIKSVLLMKCGSGCIYNSNVLFFASSCLFISVRGFMPCPLQLSVFSFIFAAQRNVGGSCSKMYIHEEMLLPLLTFLRLTHFRQVFFKHNKTKY